MTPARARARKGDGDLLRDEILDAAARLLAETGDEDRVSVRAIADAVGCTAPALYLHFPDKQTLILAVCDRQFARLQAEVCAAEEGIADPVERLRADGRAYVRFGVGNPESYRILFMNKPASARPFELGGEGPGMDAFRHLMGSVEACVRSGAMHGDPFELATAMWTVVHGVVSLAVAVPGYPFRPLDHFVDVVVDAAIRGFAEVSGGA